MAQDLIIANAQYNGVPSISIPTQGGGSASFVDVSSTTATANDVASGRVFYDANGTETIGTGTGGGGTKYGISINDMFGDVDANGVLSKPTGNIDLVITGFKSVAQFSFYYQFTRNSAIQSISFLDLEQISTANALQYMCNVCTGLQSASFAKLHTVSGNSGISHCFYSCTNLETADFSALVTASGTTCCQNMFYGCTNLETVNFSSLKTIGFTTGNSTNNRHFYSTFYNCNKLTSVSFPALEEIWCNGTSAAYGTFSTNNKVVKFYFPELHTISKTPTYTNTSGCNNIFNNCTSLTELHFGAKNQAAIEATTGYSTKWGAPSSCTIYFDL